VRRVLRLSVPAGVVAGLVTFVTYLVVRTDAGATEIQQSTAAVVALFVVATWVLVVVARPFVWWKVVMIGCTIAAFCYALFLPVFFGQGFWQLDPGNPPTLLTGLGIAAVGVVAIEIVARVVYRRAS